jgi:Domain of unknown function (DU1801)
MTAKKNVKSKSAGTRRAGGVGEFMRGLDHPLKRDIETVRQIILNVDPGISEAIKWNAPSFRTTDFFATVNLRSREMRPAHLPYGRKGEGRRDDGDQYRRSRGPVKVARQGSLSRYTRRRKRHPNQAGGV